MEKQNFYASDDKSSLELIEQDFEMARDRSRRRHAESVDRRPGLSMMIMPGIAIAIVIVVLLGMIMAIRPVL